MTHPGGEWTTTEMAALRGMRERSMPLRDIAAVLGRSVKSIDNFMSRHGFERNVKKPTVRKPKPIPEVVASIQLRDAIIRSLARYANDNAIDIDTAAYRQISQGVA